MNLISRTVALKLISPDGTVEFQVEALGFDGEPMPGTGVLHVDLGNGFESFPMNEISPNLYEAQFPVGRMWTSHQLFCQCDFSSRQSKFVFQRMLRRRFFSATSADASTTTFSDSFQTNFRVGRSVENAADGGWERGVPEGDGDRGDPSVDGDSSGQCFLTDNEAGNSDVDGGTTILTSPVLDAVGDGNGVAAFIKYYRWYSNDVGNAPAADIFEVEISNDNGQNWTILETVGPDGFEVSGGWFFQCFDISDFVTPTDQMRVRFSASDLGDGSVVEAGVDGVEIMLIECFDDEILLGDVNQDGEVNLLDVGPFVALLSSGEFQAEADMNQDGSVNLLDIEMFVAALSG